MNSTKIVITPSQDFECRKCGNLITSPLPEDTKIVYVACDCGLEYNTVFGAIKTETITRRDHSQIEQTSQKMTIHLALRYRYGEKEDIAIPEKEETNEVITMINTYEMTQVILDISIDFNDVTRKRLYIQEKMMTEFVKAYDLGKVQYSSPKIGYQKKLIRVGEKRTTNKTFGFFVHIKFMDILRREEIITKFCEFIRIKFPVVKIILGMEI